MLVGSRVLNVCFSLCEGVYGDVMRVKILFNKKDNALVQMSDSTQAQLGNRLHMLSRLLSCDRIQSSLPVTPLTSASQP